MFRQWLDADVQFLHLMSMHGLVMAPGQRHSAGLISPNISGRTPNLPKPCLPGGSLWSPEQAGRRRGGLTVDLATVHGPPADATSMLPECSSGFRTGTVPIHCRTAHVKRNPKPLRSERVLPLRKRPRMHSFEQVGRAFAGHEYLQRGC